MRKHNLIGICIMTAALVMSAVCGLRAYGAFGSGSNKLTVDIVANDYADDLESSDMVLDLYKVADATRNETYETYDYTLVEPFVSDKAMQSFMDDEDWVEFSKQVYEVVGTQDVTAIAKNVHAENQEAVFSDLKDGIYAVIPHGGNDVLDAAYSREYAYKFSPSVIALPTKDAIDGVVNSGNGSDWLDEATVYVKPSREHIYGDLQIHKTVDGFVGEPATFVFHIYGELTETGKTGTLKYDNYASVTYDGTDESSVALVTHIPAGMTVTVEEVYEGARYSAALSEATRKTVGPIVSSHDVETGQGTIVSVEYHNVQDDRIIGGNGIENNFEYNPKSEDAENGWVWTQRPEDAR